MKELLYTVRSWNRTKKNEGVILNISAKDDATGEWKNARVYVPFELREGQEYAKTALACAGRKEIPSDKVAGAKQTASCAIIRVPVERLFEEDGGAAKKPAKKRAAPVEEEDETPFD